MARDKKQSKSPLTDALRARLQEEEAKLLAELAPAREFHDRHVNDPKFLEARKTIKKVSAELAPVRNELAALVRSTGSKGIKAEAGEFSGGPPAGNEGQE